MVVTRSKAKTEARLCRISHYQRIWVPIRRPSKFRDSSYGAARLKVLNWSYGTSMDA